MYSSILIAVDLDDPASWAKALPVSIALARCFSARLTLCYVVPDTKAMLETEWSAIGYREMCAVADARLRTLADEADFKMYTRIATGSVCGGIVDAARSAGADLIVLASHKPELKDYLLGANASQVVRRAPCSVLVVRGAL